MLANPEDLSLGQNLALIAGCLSEVRSIAGSEIEHGTCMDDCPVSFGHCHTDASRAVEHLAQVEKHLARFGRRLAYLARVLEECPRDGTAQPRRILRELRAELAAELSQSR